MQVTGGSIDSNAELVISSGSATSFQVNLTDNSANGLNSNFTLTYQVVVVESTSGYTPAGYFAISAVGGGGTTDSLQTDSAANVKTVSNGGTDALTGTVLFTPSGGGSLTTTLTTNTVTSGNINGLEDAVLNVQDSYTYTQGHITGVNNAFGESNFSNTPEPSTMVLMGAALVGLGSIGRKKLGRKA
jgi:PEP-CTERM motif